MRRPSPAVPAVLVLFFAAGALSTPAAGGLAVVSARGQASASAPACQPQSYRHAADPAAVPWAQSRLGFQRVWPLTEGARVTVAVVDSGVDPHPQLTGAVDDGGDVHQASGTALQDSVGHGTLVAGIIAARPMPGTGFVGVAPQARVLSVKVADSECTDADAIGAGIEQALVHEPSVINVSIASETDSPLLRRAVLDAQARNVVVVAASGNDAATGNPTEYPAALPGVLAVGSIGADGTESSFSGTGEPIAVVAPGDGVTGLGPRAGGYGVVVGASGTSFAAPYVSGVVALVRAAHPDLSASQVVRRIEATADHPAAGQDPRLGWGVVDPYAAVTAVLPAERTAGPGSSTPPLTAPAAPPHRPDRATRPAELVAAAAGGAAVLVAAAALAVPSARRRGWRAGAWRVEDSQPSSSGANPT